MNSEYVVPLEGDLDPAQVGVKNARLTELAREGVWVPCGFVLTVSAYEEFVRAGRLEPVIAKAVRRYRTGRDLGVVAAEIRSAFRDTSVPRTVVREILAGYANLGGEGTDVAVRCSPVSPADGRNEQVFLQQRHGTDVVAAARRCFADLFSADALGNREAAGQDHLKAAMPVTVQRMVRADLGASGTVRGEGTFVRIRAAWGLGDPAADGADLYSVHPGARPLIVKHRGPKPVKKVYGDACGVRTEPTTELECAALVLPDEDINELAHWSVVADRTFHRPMELEWAKDGRSSGLYLVEAHPWTLPAVTIAACGSAVAVPRRG